MNDKAERDGGEAGFQLIEKQDTEARVQEMVGRLAQTAKDRGESLRMRMQPTLLNHAGKPKTYDALPGVSWIFDLAGAEDVGAVRDSLDLFFEVMGLLRGPVRMREYMEDVREVVRREARG